MAAKWEYRSEVFNFGTGFLKAPGDFKPKAFEERSNELGQQGWELVNVFDTNQYEGRTRYVIAIFKRPLETS